MEVSHSIANADRSHWPAWSMLAGLFVLRFGLLAGANWLLPSIPAWVDPTFQIGTYLLVAGLIWWERDHLAEFHIDRLALFIILLIKPIQPVFLRFLGISTTLSFPEPLSFIFLLIAICLGFGLWRSRVSLPAWGKNRWVWLVVGMASGIFLQFVLSALMSPLFPKSIDAFPIDSSMIWVFPYQIGYAAIDEEPLFRGFLWGYLRKVGWKDGWICIFQGALFTLAHIYLLNRPFSLASLASIFAGSLVFGLLVWRSRTLASSMVAHGFYNGSGIWATYFLSRIGG